MKFLTLNARGIEARGAEDRRGFSVYEGSRAVAREVSSIPAYLRTMRQDLTNTGILEPHSDGDLVLGPCLQLSLKRCRRPAGKQQQRTHPLEGLNGENPQADSNR